MYSILTYLYLSHEVCNHMPLIDPLKLYLQNLHYLVLFAMIVVGSIRHVEYYVSFENRIVHYLRIL